MNFIHALSRSVPTHSRRLIAFLIAVPLLAPGAATGLSTNTLLTLTSPGLPTDRFGFSVSGAGDLDGNGYDEVIVGAYLNDMGAVDAGAAFVYYGAAVPNSGIDLTLTGSGQSDAFGYSVSSAGDVNGDGYPDLIVSAIGNSNQQAPGRAQIYFGGPSTDTVADWTLTGTGLGWAVSSAGDVNGDGYADVIVGASTLNQAFVYYGGTTPNTVVDLTLTGGLDVSSAGDVNGDGYADVIVGSSGAGVAYVYYGGASPNTVADLTLTGTAADAFGASVSSAGDVNGDGYSDVVVGAPSNDAGGTDAGRAYVFYGGASPNAVADLTLTGAAAGDNFGASVSSAGDMNADGSADVVVGAYRNDAGGTDAGRAYVYFGGSGADATADLTMTGAAAYDWFGNSVSSAGDMNGDGHDEVIVGAETDHINGTSPNRAYVISLTLPSISQSYYVPQKGTVPNPIEGAAALSNFFTCPNNDALGNNARVKIVVKDAGGAPITGIAASDINIRFNGGTPAQGFTGPYADSIIANSTYNPTCPDVRRVNADAATDANGATYITFLGASPSNPGVGVRDPNRKWGHYDTEMPVYVLGVQLQGRLTTASSNGSYVLEIKNIDFEGGLVAVSGQGEVVASNDYSSMVNHVGEADSVTPKNWWRDLNSNGSVDSADWSVFINHLNHSCTSPNNP